MWTDLGVIGGNVWHTQRMRNHEVRKKIQYFSISNVNRKKNVCCATNRSQEKQRLEVVFVGGESLFSVLSFIPFFPLQWVWRMGTSGVIVEPGENLASVRH